VRVTGTCICGAGKETRTALHGSARRVKLAVGRVRVEKFFARVTEC